MNNVTAMDWVFGMLREYNKDIKALKNGQRKKVKCVKCGSEDATISKSKANGHIRVKCGVCKFCIIQ